MRISTNDGEEIIQAKVGVTNSKVDWQDKLLKGFEKLATKAGATECVSIQVPKKELFQPIKLFRIEARVSIGLIIYRRDFEHAQVVARDG